MLIRRLGFKHDWTINPGQGMTSLWVGKNTFALVSDFTTLYYSRSLLLRCGKIGRALLREVETLLDSRSKHEFLAKKVSGRVGRSTLLIGPDQRLSGEGVFNGIYYCPLGFRAPFTCISWCMRLVILMFWLRASILSIVNSLDALSHEPAMLRHWA